MINSHNNTELPFISVVLPIYNAGKYLEKSITSVLLQGYKKYEFLILDDCSTDGSKEYLQNINSNNIKIYYNEINRGLFFNLNFLINKAKGSLVKLWSQDDIMNPSCLESFAAFHFSHPKIGFSYCNRDQINEDGIIYRSNRLDNTPSLISTELHARISFFTGSIAGNIANVCLSMPAIKKVGLFREDMKISADFDMWVRLAKEYETGFINQKLIQVRDHSLQLSRKDEYYIYHVKEDREVYGNLFSYVNKPLKAEGKFMLRRYKLVFYYTLMVKAFLRGKVGIAFKFYKEIIAFDNFFILTFFFLKSKLIKYKSPNFFEV
jgi:glycosyltransferase involved in cell wall biosynthesis